MKGLGGAFSSGSGLPESKQEKRERAEIAEIKAFDARPAWASELLLKELHDKAKADGTAAQPTSAMDLVGALVRAGAVARLQGAKSAKDGKPTGEWWAALPPKKAEEEPCVLCLGQDDHYRLRAVCAWFPAALLKGKSALRAADATKLVLLEDADGKEQPPLALGHPTIDGCGEGNVRPGPASRDMHAAGVLHLAEGVRLYLLAKGQVSARLQRGGASADEKGLVKLMLREAYSRLTASASGEFDYSSFCEPTDLVEPVGLNRVESACAGLRKMYVPREWDDRCVSCGTRHSTVEHGTCKFWKRWTEEAREREAEEARAKVEAPTEPTPADAPPAPKAEAATEAKAEVAAEAKAEVAAEAKAEVAAEAKVEVAAAIVDAVEASEEAGQPDEEERPFEPFMPKLRQQAADAESEDKENGSPAVEVA